MTPTKIYIIKSNERLPTNVSSTFFPKIYHRETGKIISYENLTREENGKPSPIDGLHFNISHSKHYYAVIFSTKECGIDIEEPRLISPSLKKRILSKGEKIIDNNLLNNWVIKEAYTKFLGLGLKIDFRDISAEELLKTKHIYNLSTKDYYCYATLKNPVEITVLQDFN